MKDSIKNSQSYAKSIKVWFFFSALVLIKKHSQSLRVFLTSCSASCQFSASHLNRELQPKEQIDCLLKTLRKIFFAQRMEVISVWGSPAGIRCRTPMRPHTFITHKLNKCPCTWTSTNMPFMYLIYLHIHTHCTLKLWRWCMTVPESVSLEHFFSVPGVPRSHHTESSKAGICTCYSFSAENLWCRHF